MKKPLVNPLVLFSATNQMPTDCPEFVIYIDVDKILAARLSEEEWKANNVKAGVNMSAYICDETESTITVDLTAMENGRVNIAKWLRLNTNFIDYARSYSVIQKAHVLDPNDNIELEYITEAENNIYHFYFESKTLLSLNYNYAIDIYNPSYEHYIEVNKTDNQPESAKISIASIQKFNTNSFSSALVSAIVFKNLQQPISKGEYRNCHFLFTILADGRVIMKFTYKDQSSYYDFSKNPI